MINNDHLEKKEGKREVQKIEYLRTKEPFSVKKKHSLELFQVFSFKK